MKSYEIEGCDVFALMVKINDGPVELWGIYSNAVACCRKGEKVCNAFGALGVEAWYCCKPYEVKDE